MVLATSIRQRIGAALSAVGLKKNAPPTRQTLQLDRNTSTGSIRLKTIGDSAKVQIDGKEYCSIMLMENGKPLASRKGLGWGEGFGAGGDEHLYLNDNNRAYDFGKLELRRNGKNIEIRIQQRFLE